MLRVIREIQPRWVVGENVGGLLSWNGGMVFDEVQADLEAAGYEVTPFLLPACAVNAPHRRDRIWFVAHSVNNDRGASFSNRSEKREFIQCESARLSSLRTTSHAESLENIGRGSGGFQPIIAGVDAKRDATNTNELNGNLSGLRTGEIPQQQTSGIQGCDAADTNSNQRCEGRVHTEGREETKRHIGSCSTWDGGGNWENFPTQSAICDRNDGFSDRLAGMSFSKWRNESIKAAGNAVVPSVVYQIFKAIQQYEDQ